MQPTSLIDYMVSVAALLALLILFFAVERGLRRGKLREALRRAARFYRRYVYPVVHVLTVVLISLAVILPLAELALRHYVRNYGTQQDKARYLFSADEIRALNDIFRGEPYLGFGNSPYWPDHNSMLYRGPEITQPKPPGTYRIVALGGSTTYGYGIRQNADTFPGQLQRFLRDDYGLEQVEVINAGVQEYSSWESLVNLEFRILDLHPDLLIYYEATNDITARIVDPAYYDGLRRARGLWQTSPEDLGSSALWRFVAINLGLMEDPSTLQSQFVKSDIPQCSMWTETACGSYDMETLMKLNPPVYYERNLRSMIAIAQANDIDFMLSSWTYFPDRTPITNIYTFPWRQREVNRMNAIAEQVASDTGAAFYDLHANMPYDPAFWLDDGYHQSALGCAEQARQYAAFIVAQGFIESGAA